MYSVLSALYSAFRKNTEPGDQGVIEQALTVAIAKATIQGVTGASGHPTVCPSEQVPATLADCRLAELGASFAGYRLRDLLLRGLHPSFRHQRIAQPGQS